MASFPKVGAAKWAILLPSVLLIGTALSESPAPSAPDGASIYGQRCASCHMAMAQTSIPGVSADAIRAALTKIKQMKTLWDLTPAEVQAVSAALSGKALAAASMPASAPSGPLDGAALYQSHCSSCHQPLAQSRVRGASAQRIQAVIARQRQMKPLSSMAPAEVRAIADALSGRTRSTASSSPASPPALAGSTGGSQGRSGPRRQRESGD